MNSEAKSTPARIATWRRREKKIKEKYKNMEKPKHHQTPVIRVKEILVHKNADSLEIILIEGFQAVVRKGEYKIGDLAYYIYPDSVVPVKPEFSFLWEDKILPGEEPTIKQRRISARRFRGEWSEGLLMPLSAGMFDGGNGYGIPPEGTDISDNIGIIHYEPPEPADLGGDNEKAPKSYPRTLKGWMYYLWYRILNKLGFGTPLRGMNEKGPELSPPFYDVENYKNYKNAFQEGEEVWVSEKLHGCQGRFIYQNSHMYAGSRKMWKSEKSKCIWRKCLTQNPWIEEWCRNHEGFTLYGELLPCQGEKFMYGCKPGEVKFYIFDILSPTHEWTPIFLAVDSINIVPVLYTGLFDKTKIKSLAEGKSVLDNKTVREGIVVKPVVERHVRGLGRLKLKIINNEYLSKS